MKKSTGIIVFLILLSVCLIFAACENVSNETISDAITIANLKTEVGASFDRLSYASELSIDNERGVIAFNVENEVAEIDLSEIKLSAGNFTVTSSAGSTLSKLTLNEGLNTYILQATSGTITVTYTLKITRKSASAVDPTADPTADPKTPTDPTADPTTDPTVDSEPVHTHTFSDIWSKDADYHWHAATCEHTAEVKDKAAHAWNDGEITTPATEEAEGVRTYTCTICGATKTEAINKLSHIHAFGDWESYAVSTCTAKGEERRYCACGEYEPRETEINPDNHDYNEVVIPPTCTTGGYTTHTCSRCGDTYRDSETSALGHDVIRHEAQTPTCTKVGWNVYDTCSRCDYTTYEEIEATGHDYVAEVIDPTCTEKGYTTYTCSRCTDTYTDDYVSNLGHDYDDVVTQPTCTEKGYTTHACSRCDDVYTDSYVDAPGHDYKGIITDPTCTLGGYTTYTCLVCGDTYIGDRTNATGHTESTDKAVEPTCTETGLTEGKHCSVCGETLVAQMVRAALGHLPQEIPSVEATATSSGLTAGSKCARCDVILVEQKVIAPAAEVIDLMLNRTVLYLDIGQTYQFTATMVPGNARAEHVTWMASNANVEMDDNGNVYAKAVGSSMIAALVGDFSATCEIYVGESSSEGSVFGQDNLLQYTLNGDMSAYIVTGYTGTAKTVTIPDIYNGLRVISIGSTAFKDNTYIEKVKLPNSVQLIDSQAFKGCSALKTINLPDSIEEIGESAFEDCYKLSSITIPAATAEIGAKAFYRCLSLSSVLMNDGLQVIGSQAFERCTALTDISIPNSVTSIGMWAFNHAESLSSVSLSTSMNSISTATFSGCYALRAVVIPANIHSIGNSAFSDCTHLGEVRILGDINSFGNSAFYKCVYLTSLYYGSKTTGTYIENNYIFYNAGINGTGIVVTLGEGAALPQRIFEPVVNHQNLPYIIKILKENGSVASCSDYLPYLITGITFGETFAYDGNPHTMTVGNLPVGASVSYENHTRTEIGSQTATAYISVGYAVQTLTATLSVFPTLTTETNLPGAGTYTIFTSECIMPGERVAITAETNLGYTWLGWYDGETKVSEGTSLSYEFNMSVENKTYMAKWGCYTLTTDTNLSNGGSYTLKSNEKTEAGTMICLTALTNIGCAWLGWYDGETKVSTGNSLDYSFYMPFENKSFTAKWEVSAEMNGFNFKSTTSTCTITGLKDRTVTKLSVPECVTSIALGAFSACSSLVEITIPFVGGSKNSTGDIDRCFGYIFGLVNYTGSTGVIDYWTSAYYYIPSSLRKVTVMGGNIYMRAFHNCSMLTSVIIDNGVTSIGGSAFFGCAGLTSISIPFVSGTEKERGDTYQFPLGHLFGGSSYTGSTAVTQYYYGSSTSSTTSTTYYIPSSLRSVTVTGGNILRGAFYGCCMLTSVTITSNVTSIRDCAFLDCSGLKSITIPDSVTSIYSDAFHNCSSLTSIYYTGNVAGWCSISGLHNLMYGSTSKLLYMGGTQVKGNLVIPDSVTSIGYGAFSGCSAITSVIIPASVISIGEYAFRYCSGLNSIYYNGNVAGWCGISGLGGLMSYGSSSKMLYIGGTKIEDLVIPDSVTTIEDRAFFGCTGLTSVRITNSVTSIGEWAFSGCTGLTLIEGSVIIAGAIAYQCKSVAYHVNVTSGTSIGASAFSGCNGLTFITIPSSVTSIGSHAFHDCSGLTSVTIPSSVTSIGSYAFGYCRGLTSVTIPDGVTSIGGYAFYNCGGLTSVTIGSRVIEIGSSAFRNCFKLVEIYNKSSLLITKGSSDNGYIGCYAKNVYTEEGGSKLSRTKDGYILYTDGDLISLIAYTGTKTVLIIPSGIAEINKFAFYNCSNLTSITIPNCVTNIGASAFSGCSGLTSITIPDSVTSIGGAAFHGCTSLTSIVIPGGVISIERGAFSGCSDLTSVTIGRGVASIGASAFSDCTNLTSIYYMGDIAGWCGISGLGGLMSYGSSSKMLYIGGTKIEEDLVIPDSVTSIGSYAFSDCSDITSVIIPASVISIGSFAFSDCTNLTSIYYMGDIAGWCGISGLGGLMSYGSSSKMLYIGGTKIEEDLVIPDSVTTIEGRAFFGCTGLTSVRISNTVTRIGSDAFYNCTGLTSVTIPDSVTIIGSSAFYNCSGLTSVTIPSSVTSIGYAAFSGCSGLTSIAIPFVGAMAGKTSADTYQYPFGYIFGTSSYAGSKAVQQYYYGSSTTSTTSTTYYIPSALRSVTVTGGTLLYGAFYNCSMLTSVTIESGVTSIGEYAFRYCSGLTSITYQGTKAQWNAISKDSYWNSNTGNYTIRCTDGDISL